MVRRGLRLGDLATDALRRLRGLGGEFFHLGGDDREALAGLAGPRRLDGGVQRQEVRLRGDARDHADHIADALGSRSEPATTVEVALA